jgi:hypothetical protein
MEADAMATALKAAAAYEAPSAAGFQTQKYYPGVVIVDRGAAE